MRPQILDHRGDPIRREIAPRSRMLGRYDAAQTTDENRRHWSWADPLSAKAANDPAVRLKLRERCRYEAANGSWMDGITRSLSDFTVGTGPRLQVLTGNDEENRRIESEWQQWDAEVGLCEQLWTMRQSRAVDGEAFMFLEFAPEMEPIPLDIMLTEADQVATPFQYPIIEFAVDGIEFTRRWKPRVYHRLRVHPGDDIKYGFPFEYDTVQARFVSHWFLHRRPRQFRGIPEFTSALECFAQLRRFSAATLSAAETAADFAAVLQTNLPPNPDDIGLVFPFSTTEIERRMMTTLPDGYTLAQFRAEHPNTTYPDFIRSKLTEILRCVCMPYSIGAGDFSQENYSSGRLGVQSFHSCMKTDRAQLERVTLEPLFREWLIGAAESGLISADQADIRQWPHAWLWPGMEHVDPLKEANAQAVRLANGTTTFDDECMADGNDPETQAAKLRRGVERLAETGFTPAWMVQAPAPPQANQPQPDEPPDEGPANDNPTNAGQRRNRLAPFLQRNGFH